MDIIWHGHSCFKLGSENTSVITDPFPDSIGLSMGKPEASIVTVSNHHPNHSYIEGIPTASNVIDGPGEYDIQGVHLQGVVTPLPEGDPPETRNIAYLIEMEEITFLHLGDIQSTLTTRRVEELVPVDVLFIPAGGGCTLPLDQMISVIQSLNPKMLVPMHYRNTQVDISLDPPDALLRELGVGQVVPQTRLVVTRSSIPQVLQLVLLEHTSAA